MELFLLLGIISAIGFAALSIIDRYFLAKEKTLVHPIIFGATTTYVYVIIMTALFFLFGNRFLLDRHVLLLILPIALLATLSRYGYYYALHHAEASYIAPFMKLITIFSVIAAYLFLGEPLSGTLMSGALLIFLGGYFILEKQNKKWFHIPRFDLAVLLTILYAVFVSLRGVFDKIAVKAYEPFLVILLVQYSLTLVDTVLVFLFRRKEFVPFVERVWAKKKLLGIFVLKCGLFLATFLSFYTGLKTGLLSKTLPLANTDALFVAVFAVLLLNERMTKQRIVGTILTIAGAVLVGLG